MTKSIDAALKPFLQFAQLIVGVPDDTKIATYGFEKGGHFAITVKQLRELAQARRMAGEWFYSVDGETTYSEYFDVIDGSSAGVVEEINTAIVSDVSFAAWLPAFGDDNDDWRYVGDTVAEVEEAIADEKRRREEALKNADAGK